MLGHLISTFSSILELMGKEKKKRLGDCEVFWNLVFIFNRCPYNLTSEICIPSSKLIINFSLMANISEIPNNIHIYESVFYRIPIGKKNGPF